MQFHKFSLANQKVATVIVKATKMELEHHRRDLTNPDWAAWY